MVCCRQQSNDVEIPLSYTFTWESALSPFVGINKFDLFAVRAAVATAPLVLKDADDKA